MKKINIGLSSSWIALNPLAGENSTFLGYLEKYDVNVVPAAQADYLFFTCFSGDHHAEAREDAIKILYTGENYCPDFNNCDYALSFEYLDYGDRHFRFPLYLLYPDIHKLVERPQLTIDDLRKRQHFCNFIYSNGNAEPERDAFFHALNERLPVMSAGKHLRNTRSIDEAHPATDMNFRKRKYMEDFRFSLAFENSAHPGYVTEKIADAFIARTLPVYWGDPRIADEFNKDSFVDVRSFASRKDAVDHILALNQDDDLVLKMLNTHPLKTPDAIEVYMKGVRAFLENIFDQDLAEARRRPRAGFAKNLERKRRKDQTGWAKLLKRNRV